MRDRGRDDEGPRESQSSPSPKASERVRAASGTPFGSTPRTMSLRAAISGVSAETMPTMPTAAAAYPSSVGVPIRRMASR